jgi:hypothetical protein
MTRLFTIALLATALAVSTNAAAAGMQLGSWPVPKPEPTPQPEPPKPHSEGRWIGPCEGWWLGENLTPKLWNSDPARGEQMMMRLVVCVFAVFAPGQSAYALAIADRESGFYEWAYNPSSGASGLFQHLASMWPGRAASYLYRGWFGKGAWPPGPMDPRANAIVSARMVADPDIGWAPWSM